MSVDAVGTTVYIYTLGNQLLTEDGPFGTDTVTNTYVNRLRRALALQQPSLTWTKRKRVKNGSVPHNRMVVNHERVSRTTFECPWTPPTPRFIVTRLAINC